MTMIKDLMKYLRGAEAAEGDALLSEQQKRVAVAAILVEVARRDGDYDPREQAVIDAMLGEAFDLDQPAAMKLRAEGEEAQAAAVDMHRFTVVIKDSIPSEERSALFERVWRVVLADDQRTEAENAFMRKLAGLLYVEDRESALARQRAMRSADAAKDSD